MRTSAELYGEDLKTVGEFVVDAGQSVPFVLSYGRSFESPPGPIDPVEALERTEAFWREWSDRCPEVGPWTDAVKRSLITLKALTYAPTGAIVAAATTSLPERPGGTRNWDYRYCWLRDATFTLLAFLHLGYYEEARAWGEWLHRAVAGSPRQVQIVYGIGGERRLPELTIPWLSGYENSSPVRVGNAASEQLQIDIFGEIADAIFQGFKARHTAIQTRRSPAASDYRISDDCLAATGRRYLGNTGRSTALRPFESNGLGRFRSGRSLRGSSRSTRAKPTSGAKSPTKSTLTFANVVSIASSAVSCRLMVLSGSTRACCCYRLLGSFQPPTPASVERFRPLSKGFSSTMSSFCGTKLKMPLTDYHPAKEHFWSAVFGSSTITYCKVVMRTRSGCSIVCSRAAMTLACWPRNSIR